MQAFCLKQYGTTNESLLSSTGAAGYFYKVKKTPFLKKLLAWWSLESLTKAIFPHGMTCFLNTNLGYKVLSFPGASKCFRYHPVTNSYCRTNEL